MQGVVSTKADVFSIGLTILEIVCNIDLPKGGQLWHTLRSGQNLPEPCCTGTSVKLLNLSSPKSC